MYDSTKIHTITCLTLETNHIGIGELMQFYSYAKNFSYTSVTLNISPTNHIDANLSAVILAISHKLKIERKVNLYIELGDGKGVFFRNGLISHLQGNGNNNQYPEDRESTIPLTTFYADEDETYCNYLSNDFFSHRGLDNVPRKIKDALRTHYLEIFTNVGLHANTTHPVFTCGQYFPEKRQLKFTLIDLGDGFLKKIHESTNGQVRDDKTAILWATEGINSTKDKILFGPGGTGLKEIKKYCNENNGSLHICSGTGYVNMMSNRTFEYNLRTPFPGSIINIIIRNI